MKTPAINNARKLFAVAAVLHAVAGTCMLAGTALNIWEMFLCMVVLALLPALVVFLIAWPWSSDKLPMESLVTLVMSMGCLAWFSCVIAGICSQGLEPDAEIMWAFGMISAPIAAVTVVLLSMLGAKLVRTFQKRNRS